MTINSHNRIHVNYRLSVARSIVWLPAIVIVLLLVVPNASLAQSPATFHLTAVNVEGSKRYAAAEIARAAGLKVGSDVTVKSLDEAANKLGTMGVFSTVNYRYQTRGTAMTAVFTVQDATYFLPCTFDNFVWFSAQELQDGIRARVPLFDGQAPPGGAMLDLISAALAAMLETRGIHSHVESSPEQRTLGGPITSMKFRETDVSTPIRKIDFTGVAKVDVAFLQAAASMLLNREYAASYTRDFSRGGIAAVYRQHGYLRVDFGEPVPHLLPDDSTPNAVAVTIPVTEGEQFTLKEITWSGETAIPYGELAKSLPRQGGQSGE